jgi:TonB-linked SusC/RagA family outer membrane protein
MRKIAKQLQLILYGLLLPAVLLAQTTVTGKVTDASGNALVGATVTSKSTNSSVQTDANGAFSIGVSGTNPKITISYIGFASQTVSATNNVSITLQEDVTKMSEVIVTGVASGIKRSNSANSVATLNSKELTGITRPPTLDGAISGKVAGAQVSANSGAPGGGFSMRLRGISSVIGSSEPLLVLDGVIINNDQFPTGAGTGAFNGATGAAAGTQDQAPNRIADINPADIESINILKGPSAASMYGSRANAGVIVITTKRGKLGKTSINISQDFGIAQAQRLLGSSNWTPAKITEYGGAYGMSVAEANTALTAANGRTWDYEEIIFGENRPITNTNLNISGGNERTRFYASASIQREDGLMAKTYFKRNSFRLNLDQKVTKWLDLKLSSGYTNNKTSRGFTGNDNNGVSILYSLAYIPNFLDLQRKPDGTYPVTPPTGQNPFEVIDKGENIETTNRFINSAELTASILKREKISLKFLSKGGVDYVLSEPRAYMPEDVQYQSRRANPGASRFSFNKGFNRYLQSSLIFNVNVWKNLDLTTTFSNLEDYVTREVSWIQGTGLLPGQRNPSTAQVRLTESFVQYEQVRAYDISEDFNWDDKVIGRVGVRADKSTLAGLNYNKFYYFPRAAVAVNITNFGFWKTKFITQLKPRIAYGETSGFPIFSGVYSPLPGVNYGGLLGSTSPTTLGLAALDPERASELEYGLDVSVWENRISLEATFYKKRIKNFLFPYALSPSSGVAQYNVYPVGDLENNGIELSLNAQLVRNKNINWSTGIQWWKNETEVTRLVVPPAFVAGSGFGAYGRKRLQLGYSPTAWWGFDASNTLVTYKDYQPEFQMSWSNNVRFFKNFEFSMLLHVSEGNHNSTLTRLTKDEGGTTKDWSDPAKSGSGTIGVERQNTIINNFVLDASYIRLREAALYYSLPKNILTRAFKGNVENIRFGISGQNLFTITDYYGYDPESSNFVTSAVGGGGALVGGVDLGPYPAVRRLFFHVNVSF